MSDLFWKKILGVGQVIVGGALVIQGLKRASGTAPEALFGQRQLNGRRQLRGLGQAGPAVEKVTLEEIGDIDERVDRIIGMAKKSSLDPRTRERAMSVLTRTCGRDYCVPEKNFLGEVNAIFASLRDPRSPNAMRYVKDHVEVDQFQSARVSAIFKGGDCDDQVIVLCAMLASVGYPVGVRVVQTTGEVAPNHIYAIVGLPPHNPDKWMPLDPTVKGARPGWEVPGGEAAALNGQAVGDVIWAKDYFIDGYGR